MRTDRTSLICLDRGRWRLHTPSNACRRQRSRTCRICVSWDRFIGETMEQLFALATVMVTVAFAVVYTIAALNGPSKVK